MLQNFTDKYNYDIKTLYNQRHSSMNWIMLDNLELVLKINEVHIFIQVQISLQKVLTCMVKDRHSVCQKLYDNKRIS